MQRKPTCIRKFDEDPDVVISLLQQGFKINLQINMNFTGRLLQYKIHDNKQNLTIPAIDKQIHTQLIGQERVSSLL